jgi:tetratricopeptide (TPR) repeat protein
LLGNVLAEKGDFAKAAENFKKAVELQPDKWENHQNLIDALEASGNIDSAIQVAQYAIGYFEAHNRQKEATAAQKYLDRLQTPNKN